MTDPNSNEWNRLTDFKSFGLGPNKRNTWTCLQKKLLPSKTEFTMVISHLLQDSRFLCEYSPFVFTSLLNKHVGNIMAHYGLVLVYSKGNFWPFFFYSFLFFQCSCKVFCKILMPFHMVSILAFKDHFSKLLFFYTLGCSKKSDESVVFGLTCLGWRGLFGNGRRCWTLLRPWRRTNFHRR